MASSLYGKAPGVRRQSGPGGATSPTVNITARGGNSLSLQTQPIIIILDGVPIRNGAVSNDNYWGDQRQRGNALNDINPEDIGKFRY
ncbi:MAG: TonB-dependent receptor plug domain-containing protein [Cytophagaceae bacterium]|nr:TonB-dependent receptor plug domain-containing protein [Cytophagaceae bacterium]